MLRSCWIGLAAVAVVYSQGGASSPAFEAATVKVAADSPVGSSMHLNGCTGGPGSRDPGQYICRGLSLKTLIDTAYGKLPSDVSGPAWIESEQYDIIAKVPAGATREQLAPMLEALLVERFGLEVRRETKSVQTLALVAPHGAAKLKMEPPADQPPDPDAEAARGRAAGQRHRSWGPGVHAVLVMDQHMSMGDLAGVLAKVLDQPVHDMTGIAGRFTIELDFARDGGPAIADDAQHPPTVHEALDQVGLKLESRKGDVETLVVEKALKKPREN